MNIKTKLSNQRGDAGMIVVSIIAIVAVIAAVYFAYQAGSKTSTTTTSTAATSTPSVAKAAHTADEAVTQVKALYAAYEPASDQAKAKPYIAPEYVSELFATTAYDPIMCNQGGSDDPLRTALTSSTAATAVVTVKQKFEDGDNVINLEVRLSDLLVTKITCVNRS